MIPTLYKPVVWQFKNRWRSGEDRKTLFARDFFLFLLTMLLMVATYQGTLSTLLALKEKHDVLYVSPTTPLSIMFLFLLGLLFFSGAISTLGTLFLGKDLEFLLASPIRTGRFFLGKFFHVLCSSAWMLLVFGIPMLIAFGNFYGTSLWYYIIGSTLLVPLFCIPTALAFIAVTLFAHLVPVHRTRDLFLLALMIALGAFFFFFHSDSNAVSDPREIQELLRYTSLSSSVNLTWLPSFWISESLGELLEPSSRPITLYILLLSLTTVASMSAAFLIVHQLYRSAYAKSQAHSLGIRINARKARHRFWTLKQWIPAPYRAIFGKEYKVFSRDMTQAVQLVLLLGLCFIYLYNFQSSYITGDPTIPENRWWQAFLVIANLIMGSFVITAVCARFVFPSVSLEGQAFWMLQSSPNSLLKLMKAKFWFWFIPIGTISSVIFTSGALAIQADIHIVYVHALCSWILSYGVVAMAIGMGAYFSHFDWDHSAQLTTSFGNFLYLLLSSCFIMVSILPIAVMIFFRTLRSLGHDIPSPVWYGVIGVCAFITVSLNFFAAYLSLYLGQRKLLQGRVGAT